MPVTSKDISHAPSVNTNDLSNAGAAGQRTQQGVIAGHTMKQVDTSHDVPRSHIQHKKDFGIRDRVKLFFKRNLSGRDNVSVILNRMAKATASGVGGRDKLNQYKAMLYIEINKTKPEDYKNLEDSMVRLGAEIIQNHGAGVLRDIRASILLSNEKGEVSDEKMEVLKKSFDALKPMVKAKYEECKDLIANHLTEQPEAQEGNSKLEVIMAQADSFKSMMEFKFLLEDLAVSIDKNKVRNPAELDDEALKTSYSQAIDEILVSAGEDGVKFKLRQKQEYSNIALACKEIVDENEVKPEDQRNSKITGFAHMKLVFEGFAILSSSDPVTKNEALINAERKIAEAEADADSINEQITPKYKLIKDLTNQIKVLDDSQSEIKNKLTADKEAIFKEIESLTAQKEKILDSVSDQRAIVKKYADEANKYAEIRVSEFAEEIKSKYLSGEKVKA